MARICPLFSGSSGNSTCIFSSGGGILIDAGASAKALCEAISPVGDASRLLGVAVTHHHIDHIKGLKTFLKKTGLPVIASEKTLEALISEDKIPSRTETICLNDGSQLALGGLQIGAFSTSHDCEGSSGYSIILPDGRKITVCTDLGIVTETVRGALEGSELVLIESNYDIEMLNRGPYPPQLKLRILSEKGHLSNVACAQELPRLLEGGTTRFILGHISRNNNLPMLAVGTSRAVLLEHGAKQDHDYILKAAKPSENEVIAL